MKSLVAALYALAMIAVAFGLSAPAHGHAGQEIAAAQSAVAPCQFDHGQGDGSTGVPSLCCDACVLTTVGGVIARAPTLRVDIVEIAISFDVFDQLRRDLDDRPDNIRSRAPPAQA